jgi:glutathione synthase
MSADANAMPSWRRRRAYRESNHAETGHRDQPLHLGIFRSDYLLHATDPAGPLDIKQVEFNTIAASFGALSQRAGEMHRYVGTATPT